MLLRSVLLGVLLSLLLSLLRLGWGCLLLLSLLRHRLRRDRLVGRYRRLVRRWHLLPVHHMLKLLRRLVTWVNLLVLLLVVGVRRLRLRLLVLLLLLQLLLLLDLWQVLTARSLYRLLDWLLGHAVRLPHLRSIRPVVLRRLLRPLVEARVVGLVLGLVNTGIVRAL